MKRCLLMVAAGWLGVAAPAAGQPPAAQARALQGKIQSRPVASRQSNVASGHAVAVVDAPVDEVLAVLTDYGRYDEFLPHFKKSRVLAQRGSRAMVYLQASIIHDTAKLWAQVRLGERSEGPTHVVEARMTDGNMENFTARWSARPLDDNRTWVEFRLLVDPDLPLPSSFVSSYNVRAARRAVRALRQQVRRVGRTS